MTTTYEITTMTLSGVCTAVVRGEMNARELPFWLADTYRKVYGYLQSTGRAPTGPPFARFTFLGEQVAVEAGFPVAGELDGAGSVVSSTLPAGPAAVTTHYGRYEGLERAYDAVRAWLVEHGREPAGPHWEIYFTDPNSEPDSTRWRTDVVVPFRITPPPARLHA